ncbi:MAG: SDR family oxidoreductase [Minisyncoccota bacterium]
MIVITGRRSQIAIQFISLLPCEEAVVPGSVVASVDGILPNADRYLFCQGLLRPKRFHEQTPAEVEEGYRVNCSSITEACDHIFSVNARARICIIGSESGYRGSYDGTYAAAKADLHGYIESVSIGPLQQIVGISPGIISDAGMTTRRTDTENLERRRTEHPKRRFLTSAEVAEMAFFLLYRSEYVSGTIVRMHGGKK